MKILLFIVLAGYAVRCDDTNYYVIQMPENDIPVKDTKKPFNVYWNVPTMQCRSKKIPFNDLYDKFGILQNKNDSFRGEKISILYDPGLFPALFRNETTGKFRFRNGGVPQEGDLDKHIDTFRDELEQSIPDPGFSGVGIIDFESWRPIFRQNFGVLVPYKDVSYEIEKKIHWWWPKQWIQAEAKQRFEEAGRKFMQTTLSEAKQKRPNAVWGYYGFPYCFNMASNNMKETCADKVPEENNRMHWLWSESTALYPSVYSSRDLKSSQLAALIRGRVREADREKRKGAVVLPYFWFRYRDGGYLSEGDLKTALETLYNTNASGFIIWGSSNDVNTVDKCKKLLEYTEKIMGPAVAKYTKQPNKLSDEITDDIEDDDKTTTMKAVRKAITDNATDLDPEFYWEPPENYTQDIVEYVEEEIKKNGYKVTVNDKKINITVLHNYNESILIDMLLNSNEHKNNSSNLSQTSTEMSKNEKKGIPFVDLTTESSEAQKNIDLENNQSVNNLVTRNPIAMKIDKKGLPQLQQSNVDLRILEINTLSETATNVYDNTQPTIIENNYGSTTDHRDFESQTISTNLYYENTKALQFFNHNTFYKDVTTTLDSVTSTAQTETTTIPNIVVEDAPSAIDNEPTNKLKESDTNDFTTNIDTSKESQYATRTEVNRSTELNVTSLDISSTSALEQVVVYVT